MGRLDVRLAVGAPVSRDGVLGDERMGLEHDVFGVLHDRINHIADTTLADGALSHAIRVF